MFGPLTWGQIVEESQKILTFIDVGGNEKYAKTMIRGICSHYPDYVMIVIDAERGPNEIGIKHFKLARAFSVPIIIVVTKIDQVSNDRLFAVRQEIKNFINPASFMITVDSENDVSLCSRRINDENIIPVFNVSCVT
jgi:elongation factor 1-alpha